MSDEPQVTRVADLVSYQGGARHVACWRSSARLGPVSVRGVRQAAVGECGPDEDTKPSRDDPALEPARDAAHGPASGLRKIAQ